MDATRKDATLRSKKPPTTPHGLSRYSQVLQASHERGSRRRDRCLVHPGTESVMIMGYVLETGAPLEESKQFGLCRVCWKAVTES